MNKKNWLIKNKNLLYALLIMPFLQPFIFNEYPVVDKVYLSLKILSAIVIFLLFFLKILYKKIHISKFIYFIFLYSFILIISTIFNHSSIERCTSYVIPIVCLILLTEMWMDIDSKKFLKFVGSIFSIYVIINLFTVIFCPVIFADFSETVSSRYYFLGEDNRFIFVMLPLIYVLVVRDLMNNNKINYSTILIYFICLLTLVYRWSVAAMIGVLLIGISLLLKKFKHLKLNIYHIYAIVAFIYTAIVVFKLHYKLLPLFDMLFNKRQTLESRYMLWDLCIGYIASNPIIGYGIQTIEVLKSKFIVSHSHNMFLQFTYETGFVGLIIYIALFLLVGKSIYKCENKNITNFSAVVIFVILLLGIFDTLNHSYLFLLLFLIYKINNDYKKANGGVNND